MRLSVTAVITLSLAIIMSGCKPSGPAAEKSPGELAFKSKCQTCHRLPKPDAMSVAEWDAWLGEHRTKAGLSDSETRLILSYLAGAAKL